MSDPRVPAEIPGCKVTIDATLRERNTFRVAARAAALVEVSDVAALPALFERLQQHYGDDILVLGGGSNVLLTRDWPGAVVTLDVRGATTTSDADGSALVRCAAGENWNDFVHWTLAQGFKGLENLALIPGTVGAAPIQNIGAYGTEVSEFVAGVAAFDRTLGRGVHLDSAACAFGYRDSRFKHEPGRYLVTAVDFRLPRERALRIDYAGVRDELAAMGAGSPDANAVAAAVVRLRRRKLPDPAVIGNAGSFFKNPHVDAALGAALRAENPALVAWPGREGGLKLSAAWLIDSCNFKGLREGDAGVSSQHALVLVNHGDATGAQLLALAERIGAAVQQRFGVRLEPEPVIV
ncbi:MAG: UDP-N-acetylmuramate dehydrogenase [Rudaea sp.]